MSGGKIDLPTREGDHELEISLKISAGRRLDEPSHPPLEGEEGLLSPTCPPRAVGSVNGSEEKSRPKEEPPLPPATPLVTAPEKRRPEKRPGECKGEEKADDREEGREGKTALPNPEEGPELEIL